MKDQTKEYLRDVEEKQQALVVTHDGKPAVKITPFKEKSLLVSLRNTVLEYDKPTEPIGEKDWKLAKR